MSNDYEIKFYDSKNIAKPGFDGIENKLFISTSLGNVEYNLTCTGTMMAMIEFDNANPMDVIQKQIENKIEDDIKEYGIPKNRNFELNSYETKTNLVVEPIPASMKMETIIGYVKVDKGKQELLDSFNISKAYKLVCNLREIINVKFKEKYNKKLFKIYNESQLIDTFIRPDSSAEFEQRLICLYNLIDWMERDITDIYKIDGHLKNFCKLLEKDFGVTETQHKDIYEIFESIRVVRNNTHSYRSESDWAYEKLGINNPVEDFVKEYDAIIGKYANALKQIKGIVC